ncbi:hypothetical protein LZ32DRAFT_230478 [Colletotrichum eremochloae]|nr:hypothetical protein LZ32DRAFT_230478 [Colletotrichum eremochloae]
MQRRQAQSLTAPLRLTYQNNLDPSPLCLCLPSPSLSPSNLAPYCQGPLQHFNPPVQSGTSRAQRQRQSPIPSLPAPPPPPPPPPHAVQALDQAQKEMAATILLMLFASPSRNPEHHQGPGTRGWTEAPPCN